MTLLNIFTDYDNYIALITIALPLLFSLFMAKRFNFIHGVICFIFSSYLAMYLIELNLFSLTDKIYPTLASEVLTYVREIPSFFNALLELIPTVGKYFAADYKFSAHIILGVYAILFILSQIISQIFRNKRLY